MRDRSGEGPGRACRSLPWMGLYLPSPSPRVTITTHRNGKGPFLSPAQLLEKQTGVVKRKTAHVLIPKSPTLSHGLHSPQRDPWKAGPRKQRCSEKHGRVGRPARVTAGAKGRCSSEPDQSLVFTGAARTAPSESYIIPQRQGDFLPVTGGEAETKQGHATRTT